MKSKVINVTVDIYYSCRLELKKKNRTPVLIGMCLMRLIYV